MRTLIFLRGVSGSGKSTFIKEHNWLEPFVLSSDLLRKMLTSYDIDINGNNYTSQNMNDEVWKTFYHILETRLNEGELTVIDATNIKREDINKFKKLAEKYRYRIYCIDFSDIPLETLKERNASRPAEIRVSDAVIEKQYNLIKKETIPSGITVINHADINWMDPIFKKQLDFNEYENIHVIGDVHGCYDALTEYLFNVSDTDLGIIGQEMAEYDINPNDLYIFCGDYLDRGPQNVETLKLMMSLSKRKNVICLEGNHEIHLFRWAQGLETFSPEFNNVTMAELEAAGISKKDVRRFCYHLTQMIKFEFAGKHFIITHGGVPTWVDERVSTRQIIGGVGGYKNCDTVDNSFCRNMDKMEYDAYSVHGHRNVHNVPIRFNDRCFNLEGKVEYGGCLRGIKITKEEVIPIEIKNEYFRDFDSALVDTSLNTKDVASVVAALKNTRFVNEKKFGNISSFNFNHDAFNEAVWSNVTVTARGLFINTMTNKVVIRGFSKFFNYDERELTKPSALKKHLNFPVKAYLKYNGFLGLLGYDEETDKLVFASKSMIGKEYANFFEEIFKKQVSEDNQNKIKNYLKENNLCMNFEVIGPEFDPHVINYNSNSLVLLDIATREIDYKHLPYYEVVKMANEFELEVKRECFTFDTWEQIENFIGNVGDINYQYNGEYIEGFVLEDANGFMFKLKSGYYLLWKKLRNIACAVFKYGDYNNKRNISLPIEKSFYDWVKRYYIDNPNEEKNILELRKMFLEA